VFPRLDAVQEVTVSGAGAGAADAGGGAVQIKFVTRSGTNQFDTSIYHYWRDPAFNTNYFFNEVNNLDKNDVIVHQYGFRVGGPIVIPGLYDGRGKAFFFSNFEHFYQPTEITRTRTVMLPQAEAGTFSWTSGGVVQSVNVLALAAANGQISATDPTITALLAKMRQGTTTTGNINPINNDVNRLSYIYQAGSTRNEKSPTNSVDVNLTPTNRIKGTYYIQRFTSNPDILNGGETRFPGLQNFSTQDSWRTTGSVTLRSTMGSGLVNEVLGGWQSSPVEFGPHISPAQFEEQGGYTLGFPFGITSATTSNSIQPRNTVNWNLDNTLSWLKGGHSFAFGGSFLQITHNQHSSNAVPTVNLGFDNTNDPARGLFTTANFPGASTNNLADARALYGLLTGRVTSINGTARLNAAGDEYVYLGDLFQRDRMNMFSAYAQDSWRVKSNLTLNYGVRWEVLFPPYPLLATRTTSTIEDICGTSGFGDGPDGRPCNMFNPGVFNNPTIVSQYNLYNPGDPGFETKYFDFGPNIGAAWRPNVQDGFLRKILGDPDQSTIRGVFSMTFNRPRMDAYTGVFGGNPGTTAPGGANRSTAATAAGPLYYPGESIPLLYAEKNRLGPPNFTKTPTYPIMAAPGNSFSVFDPEIVTPRTNSWSFGLQRSVGRDMAVEFRYVGNRNYNGWTEENWNQINIFENKFLDEFVLAQQNLLNNVQAGRGGTFAYMGPDTGTSPLPIFLAHFAGVANANDKAAYTSTNFTNTDFTGTMDPYFADPRAAADELWNGSATFRTNMTAAGLVSNFWVMNSFADDAAVTVSKSGGHYHSFVVELRRRLSRGLHAQVNYTHARSWGSSNQDLHRDRLYLRSANVPHAFKTTFAYEIPIGRGKRFGTDMHPLLNGVVGNWDINGTGRIQWRSFVFRGKVVGMTTEELQDNFKIRYANSATGLLQVFLMPQDIIDETRKAYNTDEKSLTGYSGDGPPSGRYLAPPGGPGCIILYTFDCGQTETRILGPSFVRFDLTFKKRFPFGRKASFDIQIDLLNAFDNINFTQSFNPGSGGGIFQVTSAYTDVNGTFDPGGRLGQVVWRLSF
jgi:hypothetical protein